jgi:hypothetical protein
LEKDGEGSQKKSRKVAKPRPTVSLAFDSPEFAVAWNLWIRHREDIRKPLGQAQAETQMETFKKWGERRSIRAIRFTVFKGWQGLREPTTDDAEWDSQGGNNGQWSDDLYQALRNEHRGQSS